MTALRAATARECPWAFAKINGVARPSGGGQFPSRVRSCPSLKPTQGDQNPRVFDRAARAPRSRRILGLSLAFEAQSLALAHPCHAQSGAANASERPWRTAKSRSADLAPFQGPRPWASAIRW